MLRRGERQKSCGLCGLNYKFYGNGWIEMLFVHPKYRRQTIGSLLMRHLVDECCTRKLFTSTNQSNVPMQQLLSKLEFIRSGVIGKP